jgi:DNA invertase Pin-like site-specific DNA recombinase
MKIPIATPLPLRAVVLLRKSDVPGEDSLSIEVQRKACRALIGRHGWRFDPKTDEVKQIVSGWSKMVNRDKIRELVESTASGQYDVIVMYKIDRFGRRVTEVSAYFEKMAENNVLLASTVEGLIDLSIPYQMNGAINAANNAQLESGTISTRVRDSRSLRTAEGYWQGGVPFGWQIDRTITPGGDSVYNRAPNRSKRLRRHPDESGVVDRILRLACEEMLNAGAIAKRLNTDGVLTRRGKPWCDKSVRQLLVNPVLAGGIAVWDHDPKTQKVIAWSVHALANEDGTPWLLHESAISFEEYQLLFLRFGPQRVSTRQRSGRALLSGILRCGSGPLSKPDSGQIAGPTCNGRLTGSSQPGLKSKYHCPHDDEPLRCRGNVVTQAPIEAYVTAMFLRLVSAADFAAEHSRMVAAATASAHGQTTEAEQEFDRLKQLAKAHREAAEAAETPEAVRHASQSYDRTLKRIAVLRATMPAGAVPPASLTEFAILDEAACEALFASAGRDQQRAWLSSVVGSVELMPATGRGATKGAFGSRGFDLRRVRVCLRHDPDNPIVVPADWRPSAPGVGGPVDCPTCGRTQKNRAGLLAHDRHAHGQVSTVRSERQEQTPRLACVTSGCERTFNNEAALRVHLWHVHHITEGYNCTQPGCDRNFALPAHLGRHLSTVHSDTREFCAICGRNFKKGGLWPHQNRAHNVAVVP